MLHLSQAHIPVGRSERGNGGQFLGRIFEQGGADENRR